MNISLDKASDTNASLRVTLSPSDYQPLVDKKLKQYSKNISLKGFRPGHVPLAHIQRMYGKSILVEEVNELLGKSVSNYIRENKLQVVGDPIPDRQEAEAINWDVPGDYTFTYTLGLASDFDVNLADLTDIKHYTIEAGDTEVNSTIADLQQRFHEHEHADTVGEGDTIYGELTQTQTPDGAEPFQTKTALPLNQMSEDGKATFIGKKKGDTVTFVLETAFPDEKARALATGAKKEQVGVLTGTFTFVIDDVTRHVPATINQAFFDKVLGVGAVSDEEQFKTRVQEIIRANYNREADQLLRLDIEKALLDNTPILLPDEFLKSWLENANEGKFSREQIDEQYDAFARSLKLQLLKNKLAENANINVGQEDVLNATRQLVRDQFGFADSDDEDMNATIDRIAQNYLMDEKNNGQNYTSVFNQVFDDKLMDYVKGQIKVSDTDTTVDEFKKIVESNKP